MGAQGRVVLITGSKGLIGRRLQSHLARAGWTAWEYDVAFEQDDPRCGDVRDIDTLARRMDGVVGVIHLAAVSRVCTGQINPSLCWATNVEGTKNVLAAASSVRSVRWVVFSSSREVYGEQRELPVGENCPHLPINHYAVAKSTAERLFYSQAENRRPAFAILRLSNVYGSAEDYPDRVVPAFVTAALRGTILRVQGPDNIFDFTHVDDVCRAVVLVAEALDCGRIGAEELNIGTSIGTSLNELAEYAMLLARGPRPRIVIEPSRSYDVKRYIADISRVVDTLQWEPRIFIKEGMRLLAEEYSGF